MSKHKMRTEIWICPQIVNIHAIIFKGHTNSEYDSNVPECTLYNAGHASDKPFYCHMIVITPGSNQGFGELLDCPGWVEKPLNVLILDVPEVLYGISGQENVLASQLCQCPHLLKIAGTLLSHEVGHCRVPAETQDRLQQRRA